MKQKAEKKKEFKVSSKDLKKVAGGDKKIPGGNEDVFGTRPFSDVSDNNPFLKPHNIMEQE